MISSIRPDVKGGAFGAETELRALAERLHAPVIMSPSGLGVLSSEHPLAFNILSGQDIWDDVDVALVVGTRFLAPALAWGRHPKTPKPHKAIWNKIFPLALL